MTRIEPHRPDSLSDPASLMRIVEAVAEAEGVDPLELTPPLVEVIDPWALDNLFHDSTTAGSIRFEYRGWQIDVDADGSIEIRGITDGN